MSQRYKLDSVDKDMVDEIKSSYLNNINLEKRFLACLIGNPNLILEGQENIKDDYFLYSINRQFFFSMKKIAFDSVGKNTETGLSFSYDMIFSKNPNNLTSVNIKKAVKAIGYDNPVDYYNSILALNHDIDEFENYMSLLKENGIRIKIYNSSRGSQLKMINKDADKLIEDVIEETTKEQTEILINAKETQDLFTIGYACDNYIKRTIDKINSDEIIGISSGFPMIDNAINNLQPGNMYVFAARPKIGKTSFLLKLANNICKQGIPTLYIDTEMESEQEISPRLLSLYSRINNYWIINGSFVNVPEEKANIIAAGKEIAKLPFYHVYKPKLTLPALISIIKMWLLRNVGTYIDPITGKSKTKPCAVFYDYLKVVKRSKVIKDYQILGETASTLKDLAGQFGFPMITAVQNNRSSVKDMDGEVVNAETAVAGSDEILQFTNYLFFLDKIRSYKRITNGISSGIYHSYVPGMTPDRFKAKYNQIITELDEETKFNQLTKLTGNRLLSLVAGRQSTVHDENNYFTMFMDFKHADLEFVGELAYTPIGMPKKRGYK